MYWKSWYITSCLIIVTIVIGNGCNVMTMHIPLIENTVPDTIVPIKATHSIAVPLFSIGPYGNFLGWLQNERGIKMGRILTDDEVHKWVTEGVRNRLSREGFNVVEQCEDNSNCIEINGSILIVNAGYYHAYTGTVEAEVQLFRGGNKIARKQIRGYAINPDFWASNKGGYQEALKRALSNFLDTVTVLIREVDVGGNELTTVKEVVPTNGSGGDTSSSKAVTKEHAWILSRNEAKEACPSKHGQVSVLSGSRNTATIRRDLIKFSKLYHTKISDYREVTTDVSGKLCVALTISADGDVPKVALVSSTVDNEFVENVFLQLLLQKKFKKYPRVNDDAEVLYTLEIKKRPGVLPKVIAASGLGLLIGFPYLLMHLSD